MRPDKSFWINNGPIINNLKNLPRAVEEMSDDQFRHHVNNDKNDFSNWINDILGDSYLASELRKTRAKNLFVRTLKSRIDYLKRKK